MKHQLKGKYLILLCFIIALVVSVPIMHRIMFPTQVLESLSPDGRYIAEIWCQPAFTDSFSDQANDIIFGPTATKIYASVKESQETDFLYWVPLDLNNNTCGDYNSAEIKWEADNIFGKIVTFEGIREQRVIIDIKRNSTTTLHY